jgi:hypothetical protein
MPCPKRDRVKFNLSTLQGFPMRPSLFIPLLLALTLHEVQAAPAPAALEPIPDGPPTARDERDTPVPEVTIRQRGSQGSVEEYRMGGVLYMVKVNPVKGTSYYLVDSDGDGSLETRYSDRQSGLAIPAWVLLRW